MSDDLKFQIDRLGKALNVSNNTIKTLETQVKDAKQIIAILENDKKSWTEQKTLQDKIMHQQLSMNDGKVRQLEQEIIELKAKLKVA